MPMVRTLKLRHTHLSSTSIIAIITMCPNLKRLDLGFTLIRRLPSVAAEPPPPLQKLSLTSTGISSADLIAVVALLPQLETLYLGALSESSGGSGGAHGSLSAMTLDNNMLMALTEVLEPFQHLKNINLVGNTKLGLTEAKDGAVGDFMLRVGRRCLVCKLLLSVSDLIRCR